MRRRTHAHTCARKEHVHMLACMLVQGVLLSTTDVEMRALNASLRGMPSPALEGPSSKQQQQQQQQQGGCTQSSCQILEVRTVEAPTPSAAGEAHKHRSLDACPACPWRL